MKHQIRKSEHYYWLATSDKYTDCDGEKCVDAVSQTGYPTTFAVRDWAALELVENDEGKIGETWNKIVDDFHQKNSPKNHNT